MRRRTESRRSVQRDQTALLVLPSGVSTRTGIHCQCRSRAYLKVQVLDEERTVDFGSELARTTHALAELTVGSMLNPWDADRRRTLGAK